MKVCPSCKISKTLENFSKHSCYCVTCKNIKSKEYHWKNRDKIIERKKNYANTHKDEIKNYYKDNKEKILKVTKIWANNNRDKKNLYVKKYSEKNPTQKRDERLRRQFGITLEQYEQIKLKQNNVCAICKKPEMTKLGKNGKIRCMAVDHCHKTGLIRGLLCGACNVAIGLLNDDIQVLKNSIEYLTNKKEGYYVNSKKEV